MKLKILSLLILIFIVFGNLTAYSQSRTVKGIVTSGSTNFPLAFANVSIKYTPYGVSTNFDGSYEIRLQESETTLIFSYQGFKTQEVVVTKSEINIVLQEDITKLDEVVLIGYGSSSRKDLTGSIGSLKSKDLDAVRVTSVDEFVQGRVSGVVLTQTSGQPGGASSIRIRGTSSILAGNEPLYVIDGVIVESSNSMQSSGIADGPPINAMSNINPADIKSIDVLKDASATAIYGSRGASGVIIIKTKRGHNGEVKVDFDSYLGVQTVNKKLKLLNGAQFAHYINEANYNAGMPRLYTDPTAFGEGTDWQDELFREAIIQNYNFSARGGNENVKYALSGSYLGQEGVVQGTDFNRMSFRANLDFKLSENVSLENTANISRINFNTVNTEGSTGLGRGSFVSRTYDFSPLLPVVTENGDYTKANYMVDNNGSFVNTIENSNFVGGTALVNPLAEIALNESKGKNTRLMNNLVLKWELRKNLHFKSSLGVDLLFNDESVFRTVQLDFSPSRQANALRAKQLSSNWVNESTLRYTNTFNNKHNLNSFVGFSAQQFEVDNLSGIALGFPVENFGTDNIGLGEQPTIGSGLTKSALLSYFGRASYTYAGKYIITLTGRYDGFSGFGENNKYEFFPSAALAWNISDEGFMEDSSVFSHLKLRLGYGEVGNSALGAYSSLSRYRKSIHYFGGEPAPGFIPSSAANADLKWEVSQQYNAGLDMSFFDSKLGITIDVYNKKTEDLLLNLPTPLQTGYSIATINAGNVENRGIEASLDGKIFTGEQFEWSANVAVSYNENEITNLAGLDQISTGAGVNVIDGWQRLVEGGEIGAFFGYVSDGIAQLDDNISSIPHFLTETLVPGERKYKDLNGDGVINADDRTFIGNPNPEYSFGISNTFRYKAFDLNLFIQGVYGNEIVNFNRYNIEALDGRSNVTLEAFSNRWTPNNPSNTFTRAATGQRVARFSDHFVEDGSYLRLKSITLGYSVPASYMTKTGINRMRFYVTGKNLFTLSDYSGVDPEVSVGGQDNNLSAGGDFGSYPSTQTLLFGLNFNF
ncbi:SusC/RagA family TonB-linked outer membrane protein [Flavivirga eckloniae]|uniref:TonB-dependent receptor n=1 Tax=Flavivirga eckloniae TaxID=1803846 RepID=A0A2K9PUA6_9FLAO|nr:TonB-dependent receptor [Flavivirga eckloniae]AUP80642.1 TonB-dependent receptor [Flavivirga eckloniae]